MTGMTVKTIHSGRFPDSMKFSMIFNRLMIFFGFSSPVASASSARRFSASASRSMAASISRMASAPMFAVKASIPFRSWASRNSSSESNWPYCKSVRPGSITT